MLILRCQRLGELLSPRAGAGLSNICLTFLCGEATVRLTGGCLPREAPGVTTTVAAASSRALESAPAVTPELSVYRGLDAPGAGPLICSARGHLVAGVSLLSWALLASACPGGKPDIGLCPRRPGLPGPVLLEMRPWLRSALRSEPPQEALELLPGLAVGRCSPLGSSATGCGCSHRGAGVC